MPKRILLVNDETDVNMIIGQVLEDNGYKVDSYEDPHLALKNFKPYYYDLVIIDIRMPQMNGFIFHKGIKAQDKKVKTCFLIATDMLSERYSDETFSSIPAIALYKSL